MFDAFSGKTAYLLAGHAVLGAFSAILSYYQIA
jgi:hypothetical protein